MSKQMYIFVLGCHMGIVSLYLIWFIASLKKINSKSFLLLLSYVFLFFGILIRTIFTFSIPEYVYQYQAIIRILLFIIVSVIYLSESFCEKENTYRETEITKNRYIIKNTRLANMLEEEKNSYKELSFCLEELKKKKAFIERQIPHYIGNDLNIVISIIHFQIENECYNRRALNNLINRIEVINLAYSLLFEEKKDIFKIPLRKYITDMFYMLADTYDSNDIIPEIEVVDVLLPFDFIVHIGFVINELLINIFIHSFNKEKQNKKLKLRITSVENYLYCLLEDNGKGTSIKKMEKTKGIGFKIVDIMIEQLCAKMELTNNNGIHVSLKIPMNGLLE